MSKLERHHTSKNKHTFDEIKHATWHYENCVAYDNATSAPETEKIAYYLTTLAHALHHLPLWVMILFVFLVNTCWWSLNIQCLKQKYRCAASDKNSSVVDNDHKYQYISNLIKHFSLKMQINIAVPYKICSISKVRTHES
jgi:hypothetical protein